MERPFLLQDHDRFLRLDPMHDMPDVGEGGREGGVEGGPVHGNDTGELVTE
jgi:hypothetical protein